MRLSVDHENLSLVAELDQEPDWLTFDGPDGLGSRVLDSGVDGILAHTFRAESPSGVPWAANAPATVARKGHGIVGTETGSMLTADKFTSGPRDIGPYIATWSYPQGEDFAKLQSFHNGRQDPRSGRWIQPPRPVIGWSPEASFLAQQHVTQRLALPPQTGDSSGPVLDNLAAITDQGQQDQYERSQDWFAGPMDPTWS